MINKETLIEKMKERGFVVYSYKGDNSIHFVSEQLYDTDYYKNTPKRQQKPVINIIVYPNTEEFECVYIVPNSINQLRAGKCSPVTSDDHFDRIVTQFEIHANRLKCFK